MDSGTKKDPYHAPSLAFLVFLLFLYVAFSKKADFSTEFQRAKTPTAEYIFKKGFKNTTFIEWICIPRTNPPNRVSRGCREAERTLLVFNSTRNDTADIDGIKVKFSKNPIPKNFQVLHNHTALFNDFIKKGYPENLFHYIVQFYVPFHHFLDVWSASNLSANAHVFFTHPIGNVCSKRPFATFFLGALPQTQATSTYRYCYNSHPGGVCYRYGVLSAVSHGEHSMKAIRHLKKFHNMDKVRCPPRRITLLQRKGTRIWLNIDENKNALVKAGYSTEIVDFGAIPLKKQLETIHCSRVFVGPHSAAMEWIYFMQPDGTAVEIAWPSYGWDFFYSKGQSLTISTIPRHIYQLVTDRVNNLEYSMKDMMGLMLGKKYTNIPNMTSKENVEKYRWARIGKHCNFYVDPGKLLQTVRTALPLS